jgi:hypothetical protein
VITALAAEDLNAATYRLGGRFPGSRQLLLCWSRLVWSSSGYRSMSAVCASFWHATGTVCSLPPAPVCSPAPGLASPSVHKYEAQHDYKNDTEDKHKTPTPKLWLVCGISATPVSITLLLPSNYTCPGPQCHDTS